MEPSLIARRQAASDRHDAALNAFPRREGAEFTRELSAVIAELRAIDAETDPKTGDPVERARTLTWLGSAYFDLGRGNDPKCLFESARAYLAAEELVRDEESPLFKAKLAFNFANTLRGQSAGGDIALLEAAEERYESALREFKKLGATDHARQTENYLASLKTQLPLARAKAKLASELGTLQQMSTAIATASSAERDAIQAKLNRLVSDPKEALQARLQEALALMKRTVSDHPQLFDDGAAKTEEAARLVGGLTTQLDANRQRSTEETQADPIFAALMSRLASDLQAGIVAPDREPALRQLLNHFAAALAMPAETLEAMQRRMAKLRELTQQASAFALVPSQVLPAPPSSSRAARLEHLLNDLERQVLAEATRPGGNASEFFADLVRCGAALREGAAQEARVRELEQQLWRLCARFQLRRRLGNVSVAQPRWPDRRREAAAKAVFVSGPVEHRFLRALEARANEILAEPTRGNFPDERWTQQRGASVALFWLGPVPAEGEADPSGSRRIRGQTCYDMGISLVLGLPIVVALAPGAVLPFDVPVLEVAVNDGAPDDLLADALEDATFNPPWGEFVGRLGQGREHVTAALDFQYGLSRAEGIAHVAWQTLNQAETTVDFADRLERLLAMLPGRPLTPLFPAWPASYPKEPSLFHITPFRDWTIGPGMAIEQHAKKLGLQYRHGASTPEQKIMEGIWATLTASTWVVADITELNSNVCLELGIAHAFGRKSLLVYSEDHDSDGARELKLFRSIQKERAHAYSAQDQYAGLESAMNALQV